MASCSDAAAGEPKDHECVLVAVQTLGGEAALPPGPLPADLTAGELLERLRRSGGDAPETLALLQGGRRLDEKQRLRDLEAHADQPLQEGERIHTLTLIRQPLPASWDLIDAFRARIDSGTLLLLSEALDAQGTLALAYLVQNPSFGLHTLRMHSVQLPDFAPLAKGIGASRGLDDLYLANLTMPDMTALSEALQINSSLTRVCIWSCGVTEVGNLVAALRVNRTLAYLNVGGNQVPVETQQVPAGLPTLRRVLGHILEHRPQVQQRARQSMPPMFARRRWGSKLLSKLSLRSKYGMLHRGLAGGLAEWAQPAEPHNRTSVREALRAVEREKVGIGAQFFLSL